MKYYVYVDWTKEDIPRPFYVGKGSRNRLNVQRRNWKHYQIRTKFGLNRTIVFETDDEMIAFQQETHFINQHHTFVSDPQYNDIGCNFTGGGEGGTSPSENTRKLIAENNRSRRGEKRSIAACRRISAGIRAAFRRNGPQKWSDERKRNHAIRLLGRKVSDETKQKLRIASKEMHKNPIMKQKITSALRDAIAICVLEIDSINDRIIQEHPTMQSAANSARLTVKYLRKALREDNQSYLIRRTGRKWKIKT